MVLLYFLSTLNVEFHICVVSRNLLVIIHRNEIKKRKKNIQINMTKVGKQKERDDYKISV